MKRQEDGKLEDARLVLPWQDVQKLLGAGSGNAALLYLFLKTGQSSSQAMESLQWSVEEYDRAMALLRQLGMLPEKPRFLQPAERPVYTEQDVQREQARGSEFSSLVGEVQRRLGRILSTEELKILLELQNYLQLSSDVILILINYCRDRGRARGNVRAPSMRTIEKEAYYWADHGIDTLSEAAAFVQRQLMKQSRLGAIRHTLQIHDRRLTTAEERYILKWLEMGFGEPEIALAYERTCLHAGGLKWSYMNSILESWQKQGLYTVDQIEQFDHAPEYNRRSGSYRSNARQEDTVDPMVLRAIQRSIHREGDA